MSLSWLNKSFSELIRQALRAGRQRRINRSRTTLRVEALEDRTMPNASSFDHVLLLSVDGLHQADVADPILQAATNPTNGNGVLQNILGLERQGVSYTNASTTSPSDSFPGTLAYLTGAHPGTTGVFYDDSYDRKLFAPALVGSSTPGTETVYAENLDFNSANLSGTNTTNGFNASAIDPAQLPLKTIINVPTETQNGTVAGSSTTYSLNHSPILNDGAVAGSIFVSGSEVATFTVPKVDDPSTIVNDQVALQITPTAGTLPTDGTLNLSSGVLTLHWSSAPSDSSIKITYNYGTPVYPHSFLKVNTIFNVAHDAGLPTAFSDKHPAYDIANGPSGDGVDDFFSPEINSFAALLDTTTGHTIDAAALRDTTPFADLNQYTLVYSVTDPDGPNDPHLADITKNVLLTEKYDDVKVQAILNEINGLNSMGTSAADVPALFGMNFQAVSVAQKYSKGGIDIVNGAEVPSPLFLSALQHTDASIGKIEAALKANGLWDSTMMVVTAKHGQDPRIGSGIKLADNQIPDALGANAAQVTQDDVSLIWLKDQSKAATDAAVAALEALKAGNLTGRDANNNPVSIPGSQVIDKILVGEDLEKFNLGDPHDNTRTPDIVVTLKPGFIWVGNTTNKFKRAEHGGFSPDDTHVPIIVSSGGLDQGVQGSVQDGAVETTQIAVTALKALGLDAENLQGAEQEGTKELPGLHDDVLQNINHFVVIYQENWSFDGLYGNFPGANGLQNAALAGTLPQVDVNGNPLTFTPSPLDNSGAIDPNFPSVVIGGKSYLAFPPGSPNAGQPVPIGPYDLSQYIQPNVRTGDIVHRFYHQQLQIDNGNPAIQATVNGSMDKFVAVSDNPGLVMSHFDATNLPEGLLAQQYSMDDNAFHAAYGGSFLNHQFLVAAAAPEWNQAIPNTNFVSHPAVDTSQPDGGLGKPGHDSNLTGNDLLAADGNHFAVNTTFSTNLVPSFSAPGANTLLKSINDSNPNDPNRPFEQNIGDLLSQANVDWKWYSGGWDAAVNLQKAYASGDPNQIAAAKLPFAVGGPDNLFQWHHQPFAYFDNYDPLSTGGQAHLQDETKFFTDLANGDLPSVSFIKPLGPDNEHPGYAALLQGQQHVADIVHAIQNSPEWAHTAIIITYDENGGRWDHVTPSANNGPWGDGTRVPFIVISPYAKQGYVDHAQHDTLSILHTLEQRYGLKPLNQYDANASSLVSNFQATPHVSIGSAYVQPDANDKGNFTLIVQGTEGNDNIQITKVATGIRVQIDPRTDDHEGDDDNKGNEGGKSKGTHFDMTFTQTITRLEVYGQGGNDHITVAADVTIPAFLFGGAGNDVIQAGGGPTAEVGGGGSDTLRGGSGPALLIGGAGKDNLEAGSGDTILIGGTTDFDANASALRALLNELARTDENFGQKMDHLDGTAPGGLNELPSNPSFFLTSATVHDDQAQDELKGGKGANWFFAHVSGKHKDDVDGKKADDTLTEI
jgi:phospholipase C